MWQRQRQSPWNNFIFHSKSLALVSRQHPIYCVLAWMPERQQSCPFIVPPPKKLRLVGSRRDCLCMYNVHAARPQRCCFRDHKPASALVICKPWARRCKKSRKTIQSKFKVISTLVTLKLKHCPQCSQLKLRERCMDLVSFESPEEYRHFALMLHRGEKSIFYHFLCRLSDQYLMTTFLSIWWRHVLCRQHQLDLDVGEEVQLQEQGLRRRPAAADQHQRMVCPIF